MEYGTGSHIECLQNNWNTLESGSIYLVSIMYGSEEVAIVQKTNELYGSAIRFNYGGGICLSIVANGVWYNDDSVILNSTLAEILKKYLPLTGGTLSGNVIIGDGSDANRRVVARSNARMVSLLADGSSSGSGAGLYDELKGWILKSLPEGNVSIPWDLNAREIYAYGLLKSYINGCNLIMGSQNGSFCHMYSDLPFYFNKDILINGSKVITAANFSLSGTTLTITT